MKSKSRMWLVYLAVTLATDGAALLLAFWLWRHNGSVLLATVPLILLIAGHMLFVAKGFAASRRLQPQALRSAYPQTSSQRRTTYLRELIAMRRMFGLLMPLPLCVRRDGTGTPILFVHGFICNAGVWRPLMRWLAHRAGAPMQAISLYPVLGNIDDYAAQLHEAVAAMRQRTGADKVMLVGHSMGGLVIRRYLQKSGAEHVTRVVTLGSPHHGVYISRELARWGANLGQMKLGSTWLAGLNADQARDCPVPFLTLWSPHDNVCQPQDTSRLHYPNNVREQILPGEGHDTLLFSLTVWNTVLTEWKSA